MYPTFYLYTYFSACFLCAFLYKTIYDGLVNTIFKVYANDKVSTAVTIRKYTGDYRGKLEPCDEKRCASDCTVLLLKKYVYI
jgi:hypothetical protein